MTKKLKTYWNNEGKFQKDCDELSERLIPVSGKCFNSYGELLRCVTNLYHDYNNNGFCNIGNKLNEINYIQDHIIELEGIDLDTARGLIYDMKNMAHLNSKQDITYPTREDEKYEYNGEFHQNFEKLIDAVIILVKEKTKTKKKKTISVEDYEKAVEALHIIASEVHKIKNKDLKTKLKQAADFLGVSLDKE